MPTSDRYLRFANLDLEQPDIYAQCSACGKEFKGKPNPGERVDDVLLPDAGSVQRSHLRGDPLIEGDPENFLMLRVHAFRHDRETLRPFPWSNYSGS